MRRYIDLSHPISNHMPVYPGDEPLKLERINEYEKEGHTNFRLMTGMHTGTHIDGLMHMTTSRQFISDISIERFIGAGCIINAEGEKIISCRTEYESRIVPDSIIIIHTGFGKKYGSEEYYTDHPIISNELAQLFVERHLKMVCLDTPSPDYHPYAVHSLLLKNRIFVAENLTNVEKLLSVEQFEIIALPLRILADSSPARIIARTLE